MRELEEINVKLAKIDAQCRYNLIRYFQVALPPLNFKLTPLNQMVYTAGNP